MKNNIFLVTLSKISKKDFKSFYKYSRKQYEIDSAANQVLKYLKRFYPDFDRYELEEREAFKKIFKRETFNKSKIQNALYDLNKYLKDFLILQHINNSPFEKASTLKRIFENLKLDKQAQEQHKKMNAVLSASNENEVWYWVKKLQVSHESYFTLNLEKVALANKRVGEIITDLDNFYALAKLKYACEVFSRIQVVNESHEEILHLDDILSRDWSVISTLHDLYQTALNLIKTREDIFYYKIKKTITSNLVKISLHEKQTLTTYLINHTAYHIKKGNHKFGRETFELYKYRVKNNSFIINGYFDSPHFVNIVDVAGALQEFKWIEYFINQYQENLKIDTRKTVLELSLAIFHFWKKDFHESLELLGEKFKKNIFFDIKSRLIRIACKFELESEYGTEHILSECNALDNYIRRNNLAPPSIKKATYTFVKILKNLLHFQPKKKEINLLLNNGEFIFYKTWLLQKSQKLN